MMLKVTQGDDKRHNDAIPVHDEWTQHIHMVKCLYLLIISNNKCILTMQVKQQHM